MTSSSDRPDIHLSTNHGVATIVAASWLNPAEHPPPIGVKIQLYTRGGISLEGHWRPGGDFLAWAPLLRTPQWLRDLKYKAYISSTKKD